MRDPKNIPHKPPARLARTLEQACAEWEAKVIEPNAGPIQRQEMRTAFYSGAFATMTELIEEGIVTPRLLELNREAAVWIQHDIARRKG